MSSLAKYRKMRDFSRTAEPKGGNTARAKPGFSYVIQKHAARRLHYDFRLELDGVLLSWAVPKGPSLDPSVKRLAVETEPHPLEYGSFEGTIPKGEYGGGTVMVWDRGSWSPEGDPRAGYEKGHLQFALEGDKLRGVWHLVRTRGTGGRNRGTEEGKSWLLFKSHDDFADSTKKDSAVVDENPDSAQSGRSLEEIAADAEAGGKVWSSSHRRSSTKSTKAAANESAAKKSPPKKATKNQLPAGAVERKLTKPPSPELATLVDDAPDGDEWLHEIKFDGYRILVQIEGGRVKLLTRKGLDWTERMPTLARAFERLDLKEALIDGEFVALNEKGVSDFQALQNSLSAEDDSSLVYYAFDLIHENGVDLSGASLLDRKEWLRRILSSSSKKTNGTIRSSEHVIGGGPEFFRKACELGLEGILSKRVSAPYKPGRGHDWVKVKCVARQEFVVVGYTEPAGSRSHLGALLLGLRSDATPRKTAEMKSQAQPLIYAGRVGTGFTQRSLKELHGRLAPLQVKEPPIANAPHGAEVRGVHWVKPELVAEVAFTGFTEEGLLRHPTFQGLREDKGPGEVVRETPAPTKARTAKTRTRTEKSNAGAIAEQYPLTNPDRVLYPEQGITKRDLLDYYALVAERMLPHVANRPLTLLRCPSGRGKCFFQKHPGEGTPKGMRSIPIREKEGKSPYSVIDDATGLFGLVQLGALEIHTWGSRADDFEHPDLLVFDLDPDPELEFARVIEGAKRLRQLFLSAKLESFVKTTGGKGLHVCVPIQPDLDWDTAKDFSMRVAEALAAEAPDRYVATVSKARRRGKIFIDYLRNGRGATFIAPYSTRARENAPVAVPLEWDELTPRLRPDQFTVRNLKDRLKRLESDPFERMMTVRQRLGSENQP